jgi:hypothetical protein
METNETQKQDEAQTAAPVAPLVEIKAQEYISRIRAEPELAVKVQLMMELGDLRLNEYKSTKSDRQRWLAKNCYVASRNFYMRAQR